MAGNAVAARVCAGIVIKIITLTRVKPRCI